MKKRILKLVLATALVLTLVLGLASCGGSSAKLPDADSASGTIEGTDISWSYDKDDKRLKISGTGAIPDVASSEDVPWKAVRHNVQKLDIADTVTEIGNYAFYYCPELEKATVPAGVVRVGDFAFAFCDSLTSVSLPDTLTSIGKGCFETCSSLEGVFVPAAVTSIGERAFAHCSSLKDAVVMAQISSLESWTFMGCTSLETLSFHDSAKGMAVADDAFDNAKINIDAAQFVASVTGDVTLTVKYVNEDGSAAAEDKVETYKRGDSYSVLSPVLDGLTADKLTVSGVISSDMTETVTYKTVTTETEAATEAPEAETEEVVEEENEGITIGTIITIVIFVAVIGAIVVLAVVMMRSDKKQANNKNAKADKNNGKNGKSKK